MLSFLIAFSFVIANFFSKFYTFDSDIHTKRHQGFSSTVSQNKKRQTAENRGAICYPLARSCKIVQDKKPRQGCMFSDHMTNYDRLSRKKKRSPFKI